MGSPSCATEGAAPAARSAAGRRGAGPTPRAPQGAQDPAAARRPERRAPAAGSPEHPRGLAAHPRTLTCAALRLRSPFTWSAPRPPPARPRRLLGIRWLRRAREPVGLPRAPRGRRRVSPARRPDPSQARPPGGAVRAAALCAPGEPSGRGVKRRAPGRRRTRGSEGSFASVPAAGRRAGLDDLRFSTTPPPHPRQPPPRRLSSDRWRDCNDALPLLRLLPATRAGCACPSSLSPVRRGRDTPQEWQAALPYPRAPREPRAATIGAGAGAVLKWVGPPSG